MMTRKSDLRTANEHTNASFGEVNFGHSKLGDKRRTRRLVRVADTIARHPGGSLPVKMKDPASLEALYHLMNCDQVTHESVLAPHRELTFQKIADHEGTVLVLHDTTELDFTRHESLKEIGQIGNGSRRGWLCHNSLVVVPEQREVLGLAGQILHRRERVPKKETVAAKRAREGRESRLWVDGTSTLPAERRVVDVCDRGADTFEFLEHETGSGRTFVIRSTHNRSILASHAADAENSLLHDVARVQPSLGQWKLEIPAAKQERQSKKTGKKIVTNRKKRCALIQVSAAPVQVRPPSTKRGSHGNDPLPLWIVRVWEPEPPEGVEALEWFLLTNDPCGAFESAYAVVSWYECRWIIEEFHKAQKTGCRIEGPQFTSLDRLHPMIGLLSIVALTLLNLRDLSRREDAKSRPARDVISWEYISLLSQWRHGHEREDWTIHDFCYALARLGGHQNRRSDHPPGWIVLWRGWTHLQAMMDGASVIKRINRCA